MRFWNRVGSATRNAPGGRVPNARCRPSLANIVALTTLLVGLALVAPQGASAGNQPSPTAHDAVLLVTLTNRVRASVGESHLIVRDDITALACSWAEELASHDLVEHSPYIHDAELLARSVGRDWILAGENVGSGPDIQKIHVALVASPAHYRNLVSPEFTHVGMCVRAGTDGTLFVVEQFLQVRTQKARRTKK